MRIHPTTRTYDFDVFAHDLRTQYGNPTISMFSEDMDGPKHVIELMWTDAVSVPVTFASPAVTSIALAVIALSLVASNWVVLWNTVEMFVDRVSRS